MAIDLDDTLARIVRKAELLTDRYEDSERGEAARLRHA